MILILALIFLLLIVLIGGDRGVVSLLTVIGNLVVFFAMIWSMTAGFNPYLVTIIGGVLINCLTLTYQNGKNLKTYSAFFSVAVVMLILLAVVFLFSNRLHLEGLNEIELKGELSIFYSFVVKVDMHKISICLILIGLLGAVMDTAVSISSGLYEIAIAQKRTQKELFHSGMCIGKDILSTTVNTLFFAYIGEALMLLIYLQEYHYSIMNILNSKAFLQDFACIVFSMIGCLLIIPIASSISSKLYISKEVWNLSENEKKVPVTKN